MIFGFLAFQEIVVILVIAVLIFGPKKIPEIARGLGEGLRAMREATDEIKREVMESAEQANPSSELQKTQKQIQNEIDEAKKVIDDAVGPVTRSKR
ncbi:MAG: twin-arginine translocase TatA/TatE family subunit [Flavobacteriaceae bacterium]|nr:twin-arginine translocase TatA/TatE family subunit [Flavobacteriaceae bacterium]